MSRLIVVLISLCMLTSCTASYFIKVGKDGSAIVNMDREKTIKGTDINFCTQNTNQFYNSAIIKNIDTTVSGKISFEIVNIDSLGRYLPFMHSEIIQFKKKSDSLVVFFHRHDSLELIKHNSCHLYMELQFDREIIKIHKDKLNIKQIKSQTVRISIKRNKLFKLKQTKSVIIKT